jgi:prepilin-type N-terminal cleavage/methylation domain-containing protein
MAAATHFRINFGTQKAASTTTSMYPTKTIKPTSRGGFTLVEVLVSVAIASITLTGIMSTFVMLGRSSYNAGSYSIMEAQSRRALEMFSEDARRASAITWTSSQNITFTVNSLSGTTTITSSVRYVYDSTAKTFSRTSGTQTLVLMRDVSDFMYRRYKVVNGVDYTASNDLETKQLQITLRSSRSRSTVVDATNAVLSARVVLRNKAVST